jgi:gamma-glutamyltranspeptidase/glutathione hydrolase
VKGAIAAGHPLTAAAGARVLEAGGNAVDACVAAAFVAWVAESPLTGPGAGGFMLVHRARDGTDRLLDFFVTTPGRRRASRRRPMDEVAIRFDHRTTQAFFVGPASCAVPGMVAGLAEAHRLYAGLPWRQLVEPAIALARSGLELTRPQAYLHAILDPVLRRDLDGARVYGLEQPLGPGDRIAMPDLAKTLELLAEEGAAAFYGGELAAEIAGVVQAGGGLLTTADLAAYRVVRRQPVCVRFRDSEFVSNAPPSAGGALIAFALGVVDRLEKEAPGSAAAAMQLAEVMRETSRARGGSFTSELYAGGLARRLLSRASLGAAAERVRSAIRAPAWERPGLPSTTHVSVIDAQGNAASLSSSTGCGSGVFVPGTGIHLNNMLGEIDLNPGGRARPPGRRLTSMMAPSIVLEGGRPRLVVGSAGSERLRAAILQVVLNVIDHGLSVREAIERPRMYLDGDTLHLERAEDDLAASLVDAGYEVFRWGRRNLFFGGVSAVGVRGGRLEAAGDPRRGGAGVVVT